MIKEPPFDGCSGGMSTFWRKVLKKIPPWEGCCDEHDFAYAKGGTRAERLEADFNLMLCVRDRGYPTLAEAMFTAVRVGGVPWAPTPWRWGFATDRRSYVPEEREEDVVNP